VVDRFCNALGVQAKLLPMSDRPRETMIETPSGTLTFQRWLVAERALPPVSRVWFRGDGVATIPVLEALDQATLVIIGPSNPYVSIDPILATPGIRERLQRVPVLAVSPIVHGRAVKGPLAEMLNTLGHCAPTAASVAHHYGSLLRGYVVEAGDTEGITPKLAVLATSTVMTSRSESLRLARELLTFAQELKLWP
jgi:LPPG:FO 2-phospho-L-lactate transferase